MTVNSLIKDLNDLMVFQNLAEGTRGIYCSHVRAFLRHFRKDPKEISFEEIKEYLLRIKGGKFRDQAKFAIAKFYNEVIKELRPLTSIPNAKREFKLPKSISQRECFRIFAAIDNLKHRTIIQTVYACGLRVSEPTRIRIRHLNSSDKTVFIEQSKGAKDRCLPVPDETWNLIKEYYAKYFRHLKVNKDDFLFEGQGNDFYSVRSIQKILNKACRKAGILKRVTVHTLRHSRATHLLMGGMDLHTLSDFLGHWDIRTTRIYLHTNREDMRMKMNDADAKLHLMLQDKPAQETTERMILEQVRALINGKRMLQENE